MKVMPLLILIVLCASSVQAAIYGEDERALVFEEANYLSWGRSVLAQLRKDALSSRLNDLGEIERFIQTKTLNEHVRNLCEDTPFRDTPTYARCSAFLVAPDLLVTAGHCIHTDEECRETTWAFTSEIDPRIHNPSVQEDELVQCERIVSRIKNHISKNDYALIKLTRKVFDRPSLKIRTSERVSNNATLVVLGHPTGLPLISTDQGRILENKSEFLFKISSDTFGGNSGSPVINRETGLVEGILTDGDLDYTLDRDRGCMATHQCERGECKGENVVRITNIPQLVPGMTPVEPIFDPKLPRL